MASFRLEASAVQLKISGATVTSIAVQLSVDSFPITPCVAVEKIECQADYTFLVGGRCFARFLILTFVSGHFAGVCPRGPVWYQCYVQSNEPVDVEP